MYQHILVPLDGSEAAERGLREAVTLAADHKARLRLLTVVDTLTLGAVEMSSIVNVDELFDDLRRQGDRLLASAQSRAREVGVAAETVRREVKGTPVADAIVDEATRHGCDLIVMGTHGRRGLRRMTLGSDAELVVRASPVPVLLVRQPEARK
jgi:nucleotide-binding universal stress UspA family protein